MCFSFKASIGTFMITWGISLYLLSKNLTIKQKQNVIFLMIVSSMQLVDAALWLIKMKKNKINYVITTFIIPIILSLQIFYNIFIINKNKNNIISISAILVCLYTFYRFNGYSKSLCNNRFASPIWGSKEIKLWEFILFSIFICYPSQMLMGINLLIFPTISIIAGGGYGSLWCTIVNIVAFYYLYKY